MTLLLLLLLLLLEHRNNHHGARVPCFAPPRLKPLLFLLLPRRSLVSVPSRSPSLCAASFLRARSPSSATLLCCAVLREPEAG